MESGLSLSYSRERRESLVQWREHVGEGAQRVCGHPKRVLIRSRIHALLPRIPATAPSDGGAASPRPYYEQLPRGVPLLATNASRPVGSEASKARWRLLDTARSIAPRWSRGETPARVGDGNEPRLSPPPPPRCQALLQPGDRSRALQPWAPPGRIAGTPPGSSSHSPPGPLASLAPSPSRQTPPITITITNLMRPLGAGAPTRYPEYYP